MNSHSRTPSLTPSKSPSPEPPVQPDHFYGSENTRFPPSPSSDGKNWLDPEDDPLAQRGIPVFKPSMKEFEDFEGYMTKVECWGKKSGIVKVIPPKEWSDALPPVKPQLTQVKIKTPIEQHMLGRGGLFRQENMEKRKIMSVREWVELCSKNEFRALGVQEVGLHSRGENATVKPKTRRTRKNTEAVKAELAGPGSGEVLIKDEHGEDCHPLDEEVDPHHAVASPPSSNSPASPIVISEQSVIDNDPESGEIEPEEKPTTKVRRAGQTKEAREASLADRAARDLAFLETFDPHQDWLPANTKASDYTPEFCQRLERHYWRNCGLGRPAWYGADTQGSLFTDETTTWNVAHLPSTLSRLLPASDKGLPGVNTPYLYFGMWRATFAWHVEDMDLFSINYIHFGAPKFWYAIPQGRAFALEQTMRGYFPKDTSQCPQFLRHKSFLASPTLLAQSSCRPNHLVQQSGEFVITFPRGYHAGFNLGLNCAESVNFALDSWLELGRRAKACECISDSVRIDVDQLLRDREEEECLLTQNSHKTKKLTIKVDIGKLSYDDDLGKSSKHPRKRKSDANVEGTSKSKKLKIQGSSSNNSSAPAPSKFPKISVKLKLGPRPAEPEPFPCCLCISLSKEGLYKVQDPPTNRKDALDATGNPEVWMAHEICANIVPETWVDEVANPDGTKEKFIFGVDGIVKDRWNLKCSACTKNRPKGHGAPVQCTKGKCSKAFHVSCARDGESLGVVFSILKEVEKEVILVEPFGSINSSKVLSNQSRTTDDQETSDNLMFEDQLATSQNTPAIDDNSAEELSHDNNRMQVDKSEFSNPAPILPYQLLPTPPENPDDDARVLKVIKKLEVQILCPQHNPAVAAAKKANKQDKIKNDLLALPSMSRIKIRVSAGVFEVSLIRVIEATSSVEVLWDRGLKKEFKWGSVVFGSTEGPVLQKPSELIQESESPISALPVTTYSSVSAATATTPTTTVVAGLLPKCAPHQSALLAKQYTTLPAAQYYYPTRPGPYDYWPYTGQSVQYTANPAQYQYTYGGYYQSLAAVSGPSQQYNPYTYTQTYNQAHHPGGPLNWQQPYQGSAMNSLLRNGATEAPIQVQSPPPTSTQQSHDETKPPSEQPPTGSDAKESKSTSMANIPQTTISLMQPNSEKLSLSEKPTYAELIALSTMQPEQIAEVLRDNPRLRDIVWTAIDEAKKTVS